MLGTVWHYDGKKTEGYITGEDKHLYRFLRADYLNNANPEKGVIVDFQLKEDLAKEITVVTSALPKAP